MRATRRTEGQAAVELVAILPLTAVLCAVVWQLVLAGHAVWSAASAARAAARAQALGLAPRPAARAALPHSLERHLRVAVGPGGAVRVSVAIPSLLRAVDLGSASASARFAPQAG